MKVSFSTNKKIANTPAWTTQASLPAQRRTDLTQRFEFFNATRDHDRSDVQAAWRQLLEVGQSPEKLYQLPEFFHYLLETARPGEVPCELYVVRRRSDARIVGLVPGRTTTQKLRFRLGPFTLFEYGVPVYQVLGSVPLLDAAEEGLAAFVLKNLLQNRPDSRALLMQAVPEELAGTVDNTGLSAYIMHGWRDCHTMPLPEDVDGYLQKLSSKKRYNLSRQVRLLAKEAGEVKLVRIEHAEQVPILVDAMRSLLSPEDFAVQTSQAKLESLARHGLLHAYVLQCGEQPMAMILGTRSDKVWHVHSITCTQQYMSLSVGTSIVHLAMQDAIALARFVQAVFGYGTPNQEFRSTNVLRRRGKVLLCRRHGMANMLFKLHGVQDRMNEALIGRVKTVRKWLKERRRAAA